MNLQLTHTKVNKLLFHGGGIKSDMPDSGKINMEYKALYSDDPEAKEFAIEFTVKLPSEDEEFDNILELQFTGYFSLDEKMPGNFKESSWPTVNAPAITFPYLRAFLASFLAISGYSPIHIPSINFVAVAEQTKRKGTPEGELT